MKTLSLVMMLMVGSVFASDDGVGIGGAQEVTRAEASEMGLNKTTFYMVYGKEDFAQVDEQIANRLKQRSTAYYSVVYLVPNRGDEIYQAIVTEYVSN